MVENFLINNKNYLFICTLMQTRYLDRIYIRIYLFIYYIRYSYLCDYFYPYLWLSQYPQND